MILSWLHQRTPSYRTIDKKCIDVIKLFRHSGSIRIRWTESGNEWREERRGGDIGRASDGQNTSSPESEIRTNTWLFWVFLVTLGFLLFCHVSESTILLWEIQNLASCEPLWAIIWLTFTLCPTPGSRCAGCVGSLWASVCAAPLIVWWAMRHS